MIMIIVVTIIIANAIISIIMAVMMLTRCFDGLVASGQTHHRPETVREVRMLQPELKCNVATHNPSSCCCHCIEEQVSVILFR